MVVNHYIGLLNLTTAFNQTRLEHSLPVRLVHGYNRLDNLPILIKPYSIKLKMELAGHHAELC